MENPLTREVALGSIRLHPAQRHSSLGRAEKQGGARDIEASVDSGSSPRTGLFKTRRVGDGAIGICSVWLAQPQETRVLPPPSRGDGRRQRSATADVQTSDLRPGARAAAPNAAGSPGSRRGRSLGDTKRSAGRRDGARWGLLIKRRLLKTAMLTRTVLRH